MLRCSQQHNKKENQHRCNENDWETIPESLKPFESKTYDSLMDIEHESDANELNPDINIETSLAMDTDIEAAVMGGHVTYSVCFAEKKKSKSNVLS
jgi:hypothetical protein